MSVIAAREVAAERERFLSSGEAPSGVRDEIVFSWQRCSSWSVQPERIGPRYEPEINTEAPLLRAAAPVLDRVSEQLGQLGVGFFLTDSEAHILDRRVCDKSLLNVLDTVEAAPGFIYAEDAVGTNGLGTAIELGRMARIDGHEHYAEQLVQFTCVGVPIFDPLSRRRIGVLDVTCAADPENSAIEAIAARTARSIEQRLFDQQSERERALLLEFMAASRRQHAGVVVMNERMMITNPQAARLLNGIDQPVVWEHLGSTAATGTGVLDVEFVLPDGRTAHTRSVALRVDDQVVGALMEIRPSTGGTVGVGQGRRKGEPQGMVGRDRTLLDAYHKGLDAPRSRVLVIRGEPGSGKLTLAEAIHAEGAGSGALVVVDAADVEAEGEAKWLDGMRSIFGGEPSWFLLRHVELLSASALRTTSRVLQAATDRGWRCAATLTCKSSVECEALPGLEVTRVDVPPLRNRLHDVPALVAAFAGPQRVAPDAVQVLMRPWWPGNVRELRSVVSHMGEKSAPVGQLTLADVPLEVRRAAPRQSLSRFERAEVHAILEALAETGGNKKDAAALLGISRSTLYRKTQAAGIDLDNTGF